MAQNDIMIREMYMARIRPYIDKNLIKVLTGQRRVGKSHILMAVREEISRTDPSANIIDVNLEDFAFSHITDAKGLHDEIASRIRPGQRNCIFVDEVQEVPGFDKVIRSLNLDLKNDIYVTGSNSAMLSSEIASRLAGRSVEIRVHPLTYSEFLDFHGIADSEEAIMLYLRHGGMPYLRNLPATSTWDEYLAGITDALVYRDIVSRHALRNNDFLQRLLLFLADNVGQIFTAKKIADYLKSQRLSTSVASVQGYVEYVREAYVVNRVRRWDMEGKRLFEIGEKYFFEDLGIRNAIIGYRPNDIGGILENAVYNHLQSVGYEVTVGVMPRGKEIDFIAERGGERKYVQVAVNVDSPSTAEREFGNLLEIEDNYEKILVTLRDSAPNTYEGIKMMSLREFCRSVVDVSSAGDEG